MQRTVLMIMAVVIALGAFAATASAQPAAPTPGQPIQLHVQPSDGPPGAARAGVTVPEPAAGQLVDDPHGDRVESSGKGMALLFWIFAAASIIGALFVVSRRNLIAAVMGMVGSFLAIAAVYMMLYAQFLAVIQMLVYAGAIMVLFVFVIMILNRPEDEPVAPTGHIGQAIGGISILYLIARLAMLLAHVHPPGDPGKIEAAEAAHAKSETALADLQVARDKAIAEAEDARIKAGSAGSTLPGADQVAAQYDKAIAAAEDRIELAQHNLDVVTAKVAPGKVQLPGGEPADWGTVRAVGSDLFQGGLFPFEAISILLLIAVVGAIAIAKPLKDDDGEDSGAGLGEDLATAASGTPNTDGGHA